MKIVAQRTGLTPHVVRAWEKRYAAVTPDRSGTNRRLYSESDIERLTLLHRLTKAGHSIGQIAQLSTEQLQELMEHTVHRESSQLEVLNASIASSDDHDSKGGQAVSNYLDRALRACRNMDQQALEAVLDAAVVDLGYSGLIEQLAGPLITAIGEEWHEGTMTAAQEHAATATIRSHIENHVRLYPSSGGAPTIVITTPSGQVHELGAVLATAAARKAGWNVIYLGASLPAAEIASAVRQGKATALALSISFPADDPGMAEELKLLRRLTGNQVCILAGGRCAPAYTAALRDADILHLESLQALRDELRQLRNHRSGNPIDRTGS